MQEETFTNENAKQDMEMEKLTDTRMHKKALANGHAEQHTDANGNAEQDTESNKGLHSQDNQDAKDRMTDILHHDEIGETIITAAEQSLKTEADTSQKNRDTMSKQSENNFDQQKEKVIEAVARLDSTQHKIGMEKTYTNDTGNIQIYEDKKSPLLGRDLDVSTNSGTEGNTDGKAKLTDFLHIEIEVAIITVVEQTLETEADTKQNEMAKQSGNNVDEQKEEAIEAVDLFESTQHGLGTEYIYIKGTEKERNLKKLCQPCQKNSNYVTACHWCLNCEEAFCECCKENHPQEHKLEKITSPHEVIKISNWCGNHPDRQYQYFCKDHYLLCCDECKNIDHRDCHVIVSIADESKGFITSEVVAKYKRVLKTISKSFDDLKDIIEQGMHDAKQTTYNLQLKLEKICHRLLKGDQLKRFKELFPKHIKDDRNICLSKLQKQLPVVSKCKSYINTIETSFETIMQQCHEEQVFRMVYISTKFLASTLKNVISDSQNIELVFNPILVGGKNVMFEIGEEKRVIPQNLTALLARKRRDEYGTQNIGVKTI